jgi:hypothetical protein
MKKILLVAALILALGAGPALAADTEVSAGITPGSPFYSVGRLVERIQLVFTFGPEAKVKALTKMGLKRLAEAEAVDDPGTIGRLIADYHSHLSDAKKLAGDNTDSLTRLTETESTAVDKLRGLGRGKVKVDKALGTTVDRLSDVSDHLGELSADLPDPAKDTVAGALDKARQRISEVRGGSNNDAAGRVLDATGKHGDVLEGVLNKTPAQAEEGLKKAIDRSARRAVAPVR